MSFPDLTIIGERINPGFKSSLALLRCGDIEGLQKLAIEQVAKGAKYLTVNVGDWVDNDPTFIVKLTRALQDVVSVPLAFDYPSLAVQQMCLEAYDPARAKGQKPIVNSITEKRWDMLEALSIQPARVILMASERVEDGVEVPNRSVEEVVLTARRSVERALNSPYQLTPDDLIIDVSVCPLASDTDGVLRRAVESIQALGRDPVTRDCHLLVGLSNIGIMLPKLAVDGRKLGTTVESAFLTMTVPHGLDMILGTPGREYQHLGDDDMILRIVREAIYSDGFDGLMKVQQLYSGSETHV